MMLYQDLYTLLLPPSIFIISLALFSGWLYHRDKTGARILAAITICFYFLTIPLVSNYLIHSLESAYQPPAHITGCDVIVMLGGGATLDTPNINGSGHLSGNSANRLLTTAILSKRTNLPVIISGGQVVADSGDEADIAKRLLVQLGVADKMIIPENKSANTIENAKYVKELLKSHHFHKPLLVTSAFHMPRAVQDFARQGIKVEPFPTDYLCDVHLSLHLSSFIPSYSALYGVGLSFKEYLGIAAGLVRGD